MVKANQWKLNKLTGAIILASSIALVACGDDDDSNTTNTGASAVSTGTVVSVKSPVGSVSGLVQDTNGNPIADAVIYIGNKSATSNAGGLYYFDSVRVTQTVAREDGTYAQAVTVSIVPPAGYLGATVTVQPQAQIFEYSTGAGSDGETVSSPNTVFIDGFVAEAGAAVLPKLEASVSGILRNKNTEAALANTTLSLDVVSVNGENQEQTPNGVTLSYATPNFSAVTDAEGNFAFDELPADTVLNITANKFEIFGAATQVDTSDEYGMRGLSVAAVPFEYVDAIAPWVKKVAEVGNQLASPGLLTKDFGTTLTIQFTEDLDATAINKDSIVVRGVIATAPTLNSTYIENTNPVVAGNTLIIQLNKAVKPGTDLDVWLLKDNFKDTSGNQIATGDDVAFDADAITATSSNYVKLSLKSYKEANKDAEAVAEVAQNKSDDFGFDELEMIQSGVNTSSTAYTTFLDADDTTVGIQQLNSDAEAGTRLSTLLSGLYKSVNPNYKPSTDPDITTVTTNTASISFKPSQASYYEITITDKRGIDVLKSLSGSPVLYGAEQVASVIEDIYRIKPTVDTTSEDARITVITGSGVHPSNILTITPFDDFGYAGTPTSIELKDNVAPTTILQTSYGMGDKNNGQFVSLQYGDGGEQVSLAEVTPGTPYYDLTPRLFGEVDGTAGTDSNKKYINTFERLYEYNAVNPVGSSNTGTTVGNQFITKDKGVYDKTALENYIAGYDFSRTLGVAFSEDIALTDTAPKYTSVGSASVPASFAVNNNVVIDDNGTKQEVKDAKDVIISTNADLVNFELENIYDFALQENGAVLDFTGAVQDLAGNKAEEETENSILKTNNAKVVFRDMIPPLVKSAVYRGREFVVTFDKAINTEALAKGSLKLTDGTLVEIDFTNSDNWSYDANTFTLIIKRAAIPATIKLNANFALGQYNDYQANNLGANISGVQYKHGRLDFSAIENINGASWSDYDNSSVEEGNEGYWKKPTFAAVNIVNTLSATDNQSALGGVNSAVLTDVNFTVSHQLDLSSVNGDMTASDCGLTSKAIKGLVTTNTGSITVEDDGNSCTATQNDDGSVLLSFDLTFSGSVSSGEITVKLNGLPSLYTGESLPTDPKFTF